jgi:hypothetical protein
VVDVVVVEVLVLVDVEVDAEVLDDGAVVEDIVVDDPQAAIAQAHASPTSSAIGRSAFTASSSQMVDDELVIRNCLCDWPGDLGHPSSTCHSLCWWLQKQVERMTSPDRARALGPDSGSGSSLRQPLPGPCRPMAPK